MSTTYQSLALLTFSRASKLHGGKDVKFTAEVANGEQRITCYLMCEAIGECLVSRRSARLTLNPV